MKSGSKFFDRFPLYPFMIGIYPVLFLWLANYSQVPPAGILGSLFLSIGLSMIVFLLSVLAFRKLHKAAVAAGLFLTLFLFYGHFYNLVVGQKIFGFQWGSAPITLSLWAVLFLVGLFFILRTPSNMARFTWFLNRLAGFLLLLTLVQLAFNLFLAPSGPPQVQTQTHPAPAASSVQIQTAPNSTDSAQSQPAGETPDVYYIVLDGYDREDLLKSDIGMDNRDFLTQLEKLGFVLPNCTQSNYNTTTYSVSATLNMNYLVPLGTSYSNLAWETDNIARSSPALVSSIQYNEVMDQFKRMGYQILSLQSEYPFLEFPTSDIVLDKNSNVESQIVSLKFQTMFLKTTLLERLIQNMQIAPEKYEFLPNWFSELINPQFTLVKKYQNDLNQLKALDELTQIPGKKFLYAHLTVTHPDFAFTQNGEMRDTMLETKAAYGDQIVYANQRILALVKNLLEQSTTPPIIILQGDHGYGYGGRGAEEVKILNAYHLPGVHKTAVYPGITPVNTFRLILSDYFQKDYPLLPDQSFWVYPDYPDGYQSIPGSCIMP